ncbi:MAG TPA: Zn-ribbon domain-containing OB-fold protein [Pyrodictium sp.]|nr:Zn-ribbon domain-containing OB-fold protein [Pyrodictium sp.]
MAYRLSPARLWREKDSRYRLVGGMCRRCGRRFYPPRPVCPYCGSKSVERVELARQGVVETFAITYTVQEGFRDQAPIVYAIVKLDDGARVFAPLTDVEPEKVHTGMRVEAVVRRVRVDDDHGLIAYGIKFRPLRPAKSGQ